MFWKLVVFYLGYQRGISIWDVKGECFLLLQTFFLLFIYFLLCKIHSLATGRALG